MAHITTSSFNEAVPLRPPPRSESEQPVKKQIADRARKIKFDKLSLDHPAISPIPLLSLRLLNALD
jgi:hypothetical protein